MALPNFAHAIRLDPPPIQEQNIYPYHDELLIDDYRPSKVSGSLAEISARIPKISIPKGIYDGLIEHVYAENSLVLVQRTTLKCIYTFAKVIAVDPKEGYWVEFEDEDILRKRGIDKEPFTLFIPLKAARIQLVPCEKPKDFFYELRTKGCKFFLEEVLDRQGRMVYLRPLVNLIRFFLQN